VYVLVSGFVCQFSPSAIEGHFKAMTFNILRPVVTIWWRGELSRFKQQQSRLGLSYKIMYGDAALKKLVNFMRVIFPQRRK
jgi:hypothetical protein